MTRAPHVVGLIRADHVRVYRSKTSHSSVLTVLVQETQVEVLQRGSFWTHIQFWNSLRGWVRSSDVVYRKPWSSVSTYRAPVLRYRVHATGPQPLQADGVVGTRSPLVSAPDGTQISFLPSGSRIVIRAWQQDASGKVWYDARQGWILAAAIRLSFPNPASQTMDGRPLWQSVAGKGMWLTLGTITDSQPAALARAAARMGMTHLYVEAAISPLGFHGRNAVGPLIEAAHRSHLAVIAWVYPYLYDVAADVSLTRVVAAFRTPSGERFDGIAADLERNFAPSTVHAYSQLVRAYLGNGELMVGVTYPPQSSSDYPFSEVARVYNAIAPMDYWHQTNTVFGLEYGHMRYGFAYSYRYAEDSIRFIRKSVGNVPVVPIGQTFDNFGRLEMGPNAPSGAEIQGFLAGCRAAGAKGVSFFQWMTAQVDEWAVIAAFRL